MSFIYVASPYSSLNPAVMEARYRAALRYVCGCLRQGITVYSPIVHNHHVAQAYEAELQSNMTMNANDPILKHRTWEFWRTHDLAMLKCAKELVVLQLPGWTMSVGVKAEMDAAFDYDVPLRQVNWPHDAEETKLMSGGNSAQYAAPNRAQQQEQQPMTYTEEQHSLLVCRLAKSGLEIVQDMTPTRADLWHGATGVCTEAGELLDAVKKHVIYNKPADLDNIIEELGDIEFYLEMVRLNLGISRATTLRANMTKLNKRYATGYSDSAAAARADKVGE